MTSIMKDGIKSLISKILFVIGVIIILILLAWAIVSFVPKIFSSVANVGSSFGNIFQDKESAINVSVDDNSLTNGERFTLSWDFDTELNGKYSISYECADEVAFDILVENGSKRLICNLPFSVGSDVNAVDLVSLYSKDNSFDDVDLFVYFTPENQTDYEYAGQTTVTIKNENEESADNSDENTSEDSDGELSAATITSEPVESEEDASSQTPSTSQAPQYYYPTYSNYPADLAILDVVTLQNQSAVQFTVKNIGGRSTGTWQFSYTDPVSNSQTNYSPVQISLTPGSAIRYTLRFDEQEEDVESIFIRIDPFNSISESSESNNVATAIVTGNGTGNNGGGSYNSRDDADLRIEDLEIGRVSGGRFYEYNNIDDGDDVVLHIRVSNRGGESTGSWRFEISETPYDNNDDYRSPRQSSLRPGEIMDIYLEFENVDEGRYDLEVEVDSDDDVDEEDERNNDETIRVRVDR